MIICRICRFLSLNSLENVLSSFEKHSLAGLLILNRMVNPQGFLLLSPFVWSDFFSLFLPPHIVTLQRSCIINVHKHLGLVSPICVTCQSFWNFSGIPPPKLLYWARGNLRFPLLTSLTSYMIILQGQWCFTLMMDVCKTLNTDWCNSLHCNKWKFTPTQFKMLNVNEPSGKMQNCCQPADTPTMPHVYTLLRKVTWSLI